MESLVSFTSINFFVFLGIVAIGYMAIIWYYSCKSTKLLKTISSLKIANKNLVIENKSLRKEIDILLSKKKKSLETLYQHIKVFLKKEVFKKL